MVIEDLKPGEKAPYDSDRIILSRLSDGTYGFAGVAQQGAVHAHFFELGSFSTLDEARAAGIAWAEEHPLPSLIIEYAVPLSQH